MKLSRAVLVQRTKQRFPTAGTSFLTCLPSLRVLRHIIGTKVRRPLSLRRACTLSSREYVARRANQAVASGSSVVFGHECGTPAVLVFGRPEVVFMVLPTGLVLSSNKVVWCYKSLIKLPGTFLAIWSWRVLRRWQSVPRCVYHPLARR